MKKAWTVTKVVLMRLRFLYAFIIVGLIVGNWERIMIAVESVARPPKAAVSEVEYTCPDHPEIAEKRPGACPRDGKELVKVEIEYFCPMHPHVISPEPGSCPICHMPLSRRRVGAKTVLPPGVAARLTLMPNQIAQAGLATEPILHRPLVREIAAVGKVEMDERRLAHIGARVSGHVEKLFINYVGQTVEAGDPVYTIYSPEVYSTQREYALARKALEELPPGASPDARARAKSLVEAAKTRLINWGLAESEIGVLDAHLVVRSPISGVVIEKDIHAGHHIMAGEDPYTVADLERVWMVAEVFEDDVALVKEGQAVTVTNVAFPGESFTGLVEFIQPTMSDMTRTVRVRIDVENPFLRLKPGMYTRATIQVPLGRRETFYYGCCPSCPEIKADGPMKCPKCGMELVKRGGIDAPAPATEEKTVYVCPMSEHPEEFDKPGKCPKCDMDLVAKVVVPQAYTRQFWACPKHGGDERKNPAACPKCGADLVHYEAENPLAVPFEAVMDSGTRRVVFVETGGGLYEGRFVELGHRATADGRMYVEVRKGLKAGERVVTAGAFLLDAESQLNKAAAGAYFGASGK